MPISASTIFRTYPPLTLNGNAAQVGNVLRLTPAVATQSGSAFTDNLVPLGGLASFSTYFQFQITNSGGITDEDGAGADGIVFVVQTQNNTAGGAGGGIGYQGITPSVGIEFDTYNNGVPAGDPNGNHVGVDINGSVASTVTAIEPVRFNDGNVWNAWVDYDGNLNNLEVRWSQSVTRPILPQLASNVNLAAVLGQNNAYLGFTAGTGSAFGAIKISCSGNTSTSSLPSLCLNHPVHCLRWGFLGRSSSIVGVGPDSGTRPKTYRRIHSLSAEFCMELGAWLFGWRFARGERFARKWNRSPTVAICGWESNATNSRCHSSTTLHPRFADRANREWKFNDYEKPSGHDSRGTRRRGTNHSRGLYCRVGNSRSTREPARSKRPKARGGYHPHGSRRANTFGR